MIDCEGVHDRVRLNAYQDASSRLYKIYLNKYIAQNNHQLNSAVSVCVYQCEQQETYKAMNADWAVNDLLSITVSTF